MSQARLWFWGSRALYVGPAFGLSAHRNAVAVLCVGLDARFGVARDPRRPEKGYEYCRSAFIPENTLHHLHVRTGRMAFLYVDALGLDAPRLRALARRRTRRAAFDYPNQRALAATLRSLSEGSIAWPAAREQLGGLLGLSANSADPRIGRVLERLHEQPAAPHRVARLAREVGLSPSRFTHLFKQTTRVPFRRYRLWNRLGAAIRAAARGAPLTSAALDAGFSSSAHFSAAFREMFGMAPSQLLARARI